MGPREDRIKDQGKKKPKKIQTVRGATLVVRYVSSALRLAVAGTATTYSPFSPAMGWRFTAFVTTPKTTPVRRIRDRSTG